VCSLGEGNTEKPPTFKHEDLIGLYREFNCSRMDYNTIKWRTVRFFTSLNGTTLTASIAFLVYKGTELDIYTRFLLIPLPLSVIGISYLAMRNLERESRLLWKQEASMFKIEKYLGFHDTIPQDKRLFEEDMSLVPPDNYEPSEENLPHKTLEEWLDFR
jgi:hypothetical protein